MNFLLVPSHIFLTSKSWAKLPPLHPPRMLIGLVTLGARYQGHTWLAEWLNHLMLFCPSFSSPQGSITGSEAPLFIV